MDSIDKKEKEAKYVTVNMTQGMEGQGFPNHRVRGNADPERYTTGPRASKIKRNIKMDKRGEIYPSQEPQEQPSLRPDNMKEQMPQGLAKGVLDRAAQSVRGATLMNHRGPA